MLYEDAGLRRLADLFFTQAIEMSDQVTAEEMRKTLIAPQKILTSQDF